MSYGFYVNYPADWTNDHQPALQIIMTVMVGQYFVSFNCFLCNTNHSSSPLWKTNPLVVQHVDN